MSSFSMKSAAHLPIGRRAGGQERNQANKSRREITRRSAIAGGVSAIAVGSSCARRGERSRAPNILLIITDDLRFDALGVTDNRLVQTPNIDALGNRGIVFPKAFVTTSICPTSRASILTGEYARRHKLWTFDRDDPGIVERSFTSRLKNIGYRTIYIGKWGMGRTFPEKSFDAHYFFGNSKRYFDSEYAGRHLTEFIGDRAVKEIETGPMQPFCMVFSTKAPHAQDGDPWPFQPSPKLDELYADIDFPAPPSATEDQFEKLPTFLKDSEGRRRWRQRFGDEASAKKSRKDYYRLVTGVDIEVGRIVEALKRRGLYDNTLIIFTSDNGMMLGEHGLTGKWWMFEESIRTPLIIKPPAWFQGRPSANTLALNIDIHPTILDLCGVEAGDRVQGVSLLSLRASRPRTRFFYEHLLDHPAIAMSEGVRTRTMKYIRYFGDGGAHEALYDLRRDPYEMDDLALMPRQRSKLMKMRALFEQEKVKVGI